MARTTEAAVKLIIKVNETANMLVTKLCTSDDLDDDQLEIIERWLAAHFYAIRAPRRAMEKADEVSQSFQYKVDLNLAVTTYGQTAMILDTSGALAAHNEQVTEGKPKRAVVAWLGTDDC
jgi:hypothetical protein